MADIMQNGPVIAGIDAYDDFMIYPANGQVYEKSTSYTVNGRTYQNTLDGGHAVQIVGWDTMADSSGNATPVWIIKNQWTTQWGINGYGYIRRGTNEILIEQDVLANMPQLHHAFSDRDIVLRRLIVFRWVINVIVVIVFRRLAVP